MGCGYLQIFDKAVNSLIYLLIQFYKIMGTWSFTKIGEELLLIYMQAPQPILYTIII